MVLFINYLPSSENSISLQLGSSCQGNRYGTENTGGTKSHLAGHSPPASQFWASPLAFALLILTLQEK
jgi:hypothetical protein